MADGIISSVSDTARWVAAYRAWESAPPDPLFSDPLAAPPSQSAAVSASLLHVSGTDPRKLGQWSRWFGVARFRREK